jgi:hypothetical protein
MRSLLSPFYKFSIAWENLFYSKLHLHQKLVWCSQCSLYSFKGFLSITLLALQIEKFVLLNHAAVFLFVG